MATMEAKAAAPMTENEDLAAQIHKQRLQAQLGLLQTINKLVEVYDRWELDEHKGLRDLAEAFDYLQYDE